MSFNSSLLTTILTLPHPTLSPPIKNWKEVIQLIQNRSYNEIISISTHQNLASVIDRLKIEWIEECTQLLTQKKCLSYFCENYPIYWKDTLGNNVPPSFRWNQIYPSSFKSSISIVGNRDIKSHVQKWTSQCAYLLAQQGFVIVSGGAIGVDKAAAMGSLQASSVPIEILPFGINQGNFKYSACRFSICSPTDPFSTRNAMARNKLIYAYSPHTIIVQANNNSGGTWHGAINALKKGLTQIHIWDHMDNKGFSHLVELGAIPFKDLDELFSNLKTFKMENRLFSI